MIDTDERALAVLAADDPIEQMRKVAMVARENDCGISRQWVLGWADQWEAERRRLAQPDQSEPVAWIEHSATSVTKMTITPAGLALGYGRHAVYTHPDRTQALGEVDDAMVRRALDAYGPALAEGTPWTAMQAALAAAPTPPSVPGKGGGA